MDTVDDFRRSPLQSSYTTDRPYPHAAHGTSTSDGVDTVDELLGPAATGPLIPHYDDGSSYDHRLGHIFRRLQPHHFQCR
jgi:hypothetical protein